MATLTAVSAVIAMAGGQVVRYRLRGRAVIPSGIVAVSRGVP